MQGAKLDLRQERDGGGNIVGCRWEVTRGHWRSLGVTGVVTTRNKGVTRGHCTHSRGSLRVTRITGVGYRHSKPRMDECCRRHCTYRAFQVLQLLGIQNDIELYVRERERKAGSGILLDVEKVSEVVCEH